MQPTFERSSELRISEKKTKFYLSFLEREYLRAKFKGSVNRDAAYLRAKLRDTNK